MFKYLINIVINEYMVITNTINIEVWIKHSIVTVSYTHLDVYKRQM